MSLLLGVDVGGTRSTALVVDTAGRVLGRADGEQGNYQSVGADQARANIHDIVTRALKKAGASPEDVTRACYGVAGADRPKDFVAIAELLPALPPPERRSLFNDTILVLRAGTSDGIGVAVVAGTGTNAIGRGPDKSMKRVGGFCSELGDFGSAGDLGREALRLAMRGQEGRSEPTALYDQLCRALGVDPLEDIIDLWMANDPHAADLGRLAPVVFETAAQGDAVACRLLVQVGEELALTAGILIDKLFAGSQKTTVVLGGSVLQHGVDPTLVRTVHEKLAQTHPNVRVVRLLVDPVVGAISMAHDEADQISCPSVADSEAFNQGLHAAFGPEFARET